MANKLKLGLVGADAAGRGWGPIAHIPALRGIEQIELVTASAQDVLRYPFDIHPRYPGN